MNNHPILPPPLEPATLASLRDNINNPLAVIDVEAQILLLNPEAEVREAAASILAQCRRVASFIRELRSISN
jgi:hypothetical protein